LSLPVGQKVVWNKTAGRSQPGILKDSVAVLGRGPHDWHTFRGVGSDPFGVGTAIRPWEDGSNSVTNAENRARVAFEFIEKLGAPFYAFHDRAMTWLFQHSTSMK
jgi:hypothetical protein